MKLYPTSITISLQIKKLLLALYAHEGTCHYYYLHVNWNCQAQFSGFAIISIILWQGEPKSMSDCPRQVEIYFRHVNLWHDLSVGQSLYIFNQKKYRNIKLQ